MLRSAALVVALSLAFATAALVSDRAGGVTLPARNGELVFSSVRVKNGNFDLYRMRADGSKLRRITSGAGFERYPRFSPDGTTVGYVSNRTNPRSERSYELYALRSTALRRLTSDRWIDDQLSWSPSGRHIAFASNRGSGRFGIWTMKANGADMRRLTSNGAIPAWSPDGEAIAFVRSTGPTDEIWLMDADGSSQRRLTVAPHDGLNNYAHDSMPEWAPSGEELAFVRSYRGRTDIYATSLDGDLRRLTFEAGSHEWPAWSPDGKRIVYVSSLGRRQAINLMSANGAGKRRIIGGAVAYAYPDWQPVR